MLQDKDIVYGLKRPLACIPSPAMHSTMNTPMLEEWDERTYSVFP